MRVLVCGGRKFTDRRYVWWTLDRIHQIKPISVLISGGAEGVDTFAEEWAASRGVQPEIYRIAKEDWKRYGRRAGPRRNQIMLDKGKPQLVVAFPGRNGTRDMIGKALQEEVKVYKVRAPGINSLNSSMRNAM